MIKDLKIKNTDETVNTIDFAVNILNELQDSCILNETLDESTNLDESNYNLEETEKQEEELLNCYPEDFLNSEKFNNKISRRHFRNILFNVLYVSDIFDYEITSQEIAAKFNLEYNSNIELDGEIVKTVKALGEKKDELDTLFIPLLEHWNISRIGYCTKLILRYACYEMLYTETPHKIIINEAIELSKNFSEQDAYKFVNGILDKISNILSNKNTEKIIL